MLMSLLSMLFLSSISLPLSTAFSASFGVVPPSARPSTSLYQALPHPDTYADTYVKSGRRFNYRVSHTSVSTVFDTIDECASEDPYYYYTPENYVGPNVWGAPGRANKARKEGDALKAVVVGNVVCDDIAQLKSANVL